MKVLTGSQSQGIHSALLSLRHGNRTERTNTAEQVIFTSLRFCIDLHQEWGQFEVRVKIKPLTNMSTKSHFEFFSFYLANQGISCAEYMSDSNIVNI